MVTVYAVKIDSPIDEITYNRILSYVSEEKRVCIKKFYLIEDSKRTLYGDILIRYLACQKFNVKNSELIFCKNKFGKPYLRDFDKFHYNISHSGNWVVCAISDKQIGVDIEKMIPIELDIAKRFFSSNEYKFLLSKNGNRIKYFYDLWTLKESYIKYMGKGLSIPLNSFEFKVTKEELILIPKPYLPLYFRGYSLEQSYKIHVCSEENIFCDRVQIIDINDISVIE